MNNITNVVLDRVKQIVTFDTAELEGVSQSIIWIKDVGWLSDGYCVWEDDINSYLKGMHFNGASPMRLIPQDDNSKPEQVKQERYLKEDGTDTIDKWAATRSHEVFREIMYAQVEKYKDRLGKKAPILEEVTKMADYMNRWVEYEKAWDKEDAE